MTLDKSTSATKAARERFQSQERARFGGYTGRVKADKRAPGAHEVALRVGLDEIPPNGLNIIEKIPKPWLEYQLAQRQESAHLPGWRVSQDAHIELKLVRETNLVRMDGNLKVLLERDCDRCLNDIQLGIDQRWQLHFLPAPSGPELELNLGMGDMGEAHAHLPVSDDLEDTGPDVFFYRGDLLDLEAALCEEIFLSLPAYLRCGDPLVIQDATNCQSPGDKEAWTPKNQEKWVDPRWAGLANLREQLGSGSEEEN